MTRESQFQTHVRRAIEEVNSACFLMSGLYPMAERALAALEHMLWMILFFADGLVKARAEKKHEREGQVIANRDH